MRLPRDISGNELIKYLKPYGYVISRQTGSHIRLSTNQKGEHNITIPNHSPLKVGTLSAIIADIALHFGLSKQELLQELFR